MDIISISTSIIGFLASQIIKGKGFKKATDEVSLKIWEWIRPIFIKDKTPLDEFEKNPKDKLNRNELDIKIQKYLRDNPSCSKEILELLSKANTKTSNVYINNSKIKSKGDVTIIGGNQIITNHERN